MNEVIQKAKDGQPSRKTYSNLALIDTLLGIVSTPGFEDFYTDLYYNPKQTLRATKQFADGVLVTRVRELDPNGRLDVVPDPTLRTRVHDLMKDLGYMTNRKGQLTHAPGLSVEKIASLPGNAVLPSTRRRTNAE